MACPPRQRPASARLPSARIRRRGGILRHHPFDDAAQGDRGFDVATLLFYSYDVEHTREVLWDRALKLSGLAWTTVYLCHLCLRQVELSRRHTPGSADDRRFTAIAQAVLDDCEARGA